MHELKIRNRATLSWGIWPYRLTLTLTRTLRFKLVIAQNRISSKPRPELTVAKALAVPISLLVMGTKGRANQCPVTLALIALARSNTRPMLLRHCRSGGLGLGLGSGLVSIGVEVRAVL